MDEDSSSSSGSIDTVVLKEKNSGNYSDNEEFFEMVNPGEEDLKETDTGEIESIENVQIKPLSSGSDLEDYVELLGKDVSALRDKFVETIEDRNTYKAGLERLEEYCKATGFFKWYNPLNSFSFSDPDNPDNSFNKNINNTENNIEKSPSTLSKSISGHFHNLINIIGAGGGGGLTAFSLIETPIYIPGVIAGVALAGGTSLASDEIRRNTREYYRNKVEEYKSKVDDSSEYLRYIQKSFFLKGHCYELLKEEIEDDSSKENVSVKMLPS